jgi:hypothetical protein
VGSCECRDEPSGSDAMELVSSYCFDDIFAAPSFVIPLQSLHFNISKYAFAQSN